MRVLVRVGVDVGLVSGESVEEREGPGVGLDDAEAGLSGVVRRDPAVLLTVEVPDLLLV